MNNARGRHGGVGGCHPFSHLSLKPRAPHDETPGERKDGCSSPSLGDSGIKGWVGVRGGVDFFKKLSLKQHFSFLTGWTALAGTSDRRRTGGCRSRTHRAPMLLPGAQRETSPSPHLPKGRLAAASGSVATAERARPDLRSTPCLPRPQHRPAPGPAASGPCKYPYLWHRAAVGVGIWTS